MKLFGYTLIRDENLRGIMKGNNYASTRIDELKARLSAEEEAHRKDVAALEAELTRLRGIIARLDPEEAEA